MIAKGDVTPPNIGTILSAMSNSKHANKSTCALLTCSDEGVFLSNERSHHLVAMWEAERLKLCATIVHPCSKKQCITLLKVDGLINPQWHIITHPRAKKERLIVAFEAVMALPPPKRLLDCTSTRSKDDIIAWQEQINMASAGTS